MRNIAINRCLQTENANTTVNTPLWLTGCNGEREQQWYITPDHGGRYALAPARNRDVVVGVRGTGTNEYVVLTERWSTAPTACGRSRTRRTASSHPTDRGR